MSLTGLVRQRLSSPAPGLAAAAAGATLAMQLVLSTFVAMPMMAEARPSTPVIQENTIARSDLPAQAKHTEQLIRNGGPFPFEKDGVVFGNRERLLPSKVRGYYREYTVASPRARNRGAKRIVCGGEVPTNPDNCYYTDDHYASFRRIVQ